MVVNRQVVPFLLESVEESLYKARFLIEPALEEAEPLCIEIGIAQVLSKLYRIIESMLEFITALLDAYSQNCSCPN